MNKVKIWIVGWWTEGNAASIAERCIRNWPIGDLFELDSKNYEYLVVLGAFTPETLPYFKNTQTTIGVMLEPEWSPNWQRDLDKYCRLVLAQDRSMFPGASNVIESPMFMLTHFLNHYSGFLEKTVSKTKRMSIISSNYSQGFNYAKRHSLFKALLDTDLKIDFFGRGWDTSDFRYKGSPSNKADALLDYEYSIAIENSNYKNYVTEKFFDAIVTDTVPIYLGAPNISDIYPRESFIPLDVNGSIDQTIEQIRHIFHNDEYNSRLQSLKNGKQSYYTSYNLFHFLERLISQGKL
tara:strand:- start:150 stop:1031 length:882 start_codon:yes stop_codon:yes gene_type:complete